MSKNKWPDSEYYSTGTTYTSSGSYGGRPVIGVDGGVETLDNETVNERAERVRLITMTQAGTLASSGSY